MAHEVETMFSGANQIPWHNLGTVIPEEVVTSADALRHAQLDWQVQLTPVYFHDGTKYTEVTDRKAVVRATDSRCLGVVGDRYRPLQNVEAFEFVDRVLSDYGAHYETAGSLRGGRIVWMLAQLPDTVNVLAGDKYNKYLLLHNAHDGTGSITLSLTMVRVVCMNTLCAAMRNTQRVFRIRHSESHMSKIDAVRTALGLSIQYYNDVQEFLKAMAKIEIGRDQMINLARSCFGIEEVPEKVSPLQTKQVDTLVDLFENGTGNDWKKIRGTAYAAINAATEYDSYYGEFRARKDKNENRFEKLWLAPESTVQSRMIATLRDHYVEAK